MLRATVTLRQESRVPTVPPGDHLGQQLSPCSPSDPSPHSGQKGTHLLVVRLHGNPHLFQVRGLHVSLQFAENPSSQLTRSAGLFGVEEGRVPRRPEEDRIWRSWASAGWWPHTGLLFQADPQGPFWDRPAFPRGGEKVPKDRLYWARGCP